MTRTEVEFARGRQDIVVTRQFAAAPDVVFAAMTDPELIPRWWGSRRFDTTVEEMDVRRGGLWRFVTRHREPPATPYTFWGVYHDVVPGSLVVSTLEFAMGGPGRLQLVTDRFEAGPDGGTRYTNVALFQSAEDRDGWIPTDMESGIRESLDLVDGLIG
ncbi:SRPBCC domain-containing protein [Jiangella endophytica]|uniref:SRPBCC domain-containing protein n=1 Tax=Jiangella endophytica TaxID=1623398 RepID=UPI000E34650D|nr:SRPBCC domain-containing protein [Jiangella endophytica]